MSSIHKPLPELTVPSAERNLLYLLSRDVLSDEQAEAVDTLMHQDIDWARVTRLAVSKMSLPFVYDNLRKMPDFDIIPPETRDAMKAHRLAFARHNLRSRAALYRFQDGCLSCTSADYFYVKGPTLAARYFEDPMRRVFRDIDIVVQRNGFRETVLRGREAGYDTFGFADRSCPLRSQADVKAAIKYLSSVVLIHPQDGIPIEVSKDLDKESGLFPNDLMFETLVDVELDGRQLPTISTAALLNYISYHNTRHTWSRLHWIADIDAIVRHTSFDVRETRAFAKKIGMLPLLEACLGLNAALARAECHGRLKKTAEGAQELIRLSFANLEGNLKLEKSLSNLHGAGGMPVSGLLDPRKERRLWLKSIEQRVRPDFVQYYNFPLPEPLQWFYYISRPFRAIKRRMIGERDWIAR